MTVKVEYRQSVFDLALQYFGSVEASLPVAEKLGCSITDTPPTGASFDIEPGEIIDKQVADYYQRNNIIPTTDTE